MLAGLDTVTVVTVVHGRLAGPPPVERDRLVADPSLLPEAIEELMRVQTPVVAGSRHATADFEIDGVEVKAGDELRVVWAAADMDPDVFPEPTTVDFDATEQPPHRLRERLPPLPRLPPGAARTAVSRWRRSTAASPTTGPIPNRPPGYLNTALVRCVDPLPLVFTPA